MLPPHATSFMGAFAAANLSALCSKARAARGKIKIHTCRVCRTREILFCFFQEELHTSCSSQTPPELGEKRERQLRAKCKMQTEFI